VPDEIYGRLAPKSEVGGTEDWFLRKLKLVGAVGKLKKRIADLGLTVPERLSLLSPDQALSLSQAVDRIRIVDEEFGDEEVKRAFWHALEVADENARETERAERDRSRRREVMMALEEIETASAGLRLAIAEGRLSCEELPYVARKKLSEIFRSLDGEGFTESSLEAELKAELAAKYEEIARLRAAALIPDPERAALQAEVRGMVEQGRGPELYSERADQKEKPLEFLQRVYGRYLQKGRVALYLSHLRSIDSKFASVLTMACRRSGLDVGDYVPRKAAKTDEVIRALGIDRVTEATRALTALRMRKPKAK
jgi:hypothetical protein